MTEWLKSKHDAEAFYPTLRQYAEVVRDHIAEHGHPPGELIRGMMADADPRHLDMIDVLVAWSEVDKQHVVEFLQEALYLAA